MSYVKEYCLYSNCLVFTKAPFIAKLFSHNVPKLGIESLKKVKGKIQFCYPLLFQ